MLAPDAASRGLRGRLGGWDSKPVGFVRCHVALELQVPLWHAYARPYPPTGGDPGAAVIGHIGQEGAMMGFEKQIFKRNLQRLKHLVAGPSRQPLGIITICGHMCNN